LRTSEARTAAILESVVDAVVVIDETGRIETFNQAAESTFGYTALEVMGKNVSLLMPDRDALSHDGHLGSYATTGTARVIGRAREVTGRRKDGSLFPLELSVTEVSIDGGRLFAGTCRDLTDRRRLDREIQMYAGTIEATPDFVGVARRDGLILAVNQAGRRMIGLGPDAPLEGLAVGDVHAPWSRELVRNVGLPTAIRDGAWVGETAFLSPDGTEIPMSQVIVVTKDADGEPQLVSTIARDISERKEIDRVKSEFVSTVSHELRTPLTSIRGSLGLLAGGVLGELPGQVSEMVTLAQKNTERLIRLVNNILDFEKVQAGRLELNLVDVDPVETAEAAYDAVRGAAIEAGVDIELRRPSGQLPKLWADPDRLVQILVNLLGNALKFSPPGERVVLTVGGGPADVVSFTVTDHGPGIAEADRETIFQPFQQLDSSDRRQFGGTGLGLAIAKSIAEMHGGRIDVENVDRGGTGFVLSIPTRPAATRRDGTVELAGDARHERPDVLVAEDDPSTSLVMRRLLESRGFRCAVAADGHEVVALVHDLEPRMLVLDIGLPGADGFDVVQRLRQDGYGPLPLVIYTGRDLTPTERDRLQLGATRHLTKSRASEEALASAVAALLRAGEHEVLS
jgi:PAS domain S-box-containing protein